MPSKTSSQHQKLTVSKRVAAEDLLRGDYVTLLYYIVEMPTFLWDCGVGNHSPEDLVRTRYLPEEAGVPFRVVDVCLPFIYTRRPNGIQVTFDVRRHELVRLDPQCGHRAWKRQQPETKKKKNKAKKKNK
ncbi:MAG: hypothetical protein ACE361_00685 [Aureliella sp.]